MSIRTDLVSELQNDGHDNLAGIKTHEEQIQNVTISTVTILTDLAAKNIGKPKGIYCTISFPRLDFIVDTDCVIKATVKSLKTVCKNPIKQALVVGLGNTDITPDALGPFVCDRVLATRHLTDQLKQNLGLEKLKSVCCISPNVLGKTGIEGYDLVCSISREIKPDLIIAVDALAAREVDRLCRTIQISNTGICAGSGVNNARKELSQITLGVPVIAVGIPTVIDANSFFNTQENMMVTPKEIDLLVEKSADILSRAINVFLQPEIDISIIESLA